MKIEMDLYDIIDEVVSNTPEDRMWEIIEGFMWRKPILKMCSEALAEEYSRKCYNTHLHENRALFLKHIQQEEIKFYASVISDKLSDADRHDKSFWILYHWCSEHDVFRTHGYPCGDLPLKTDFNAKRELEDVIYKSFLEKFPELKDGEKE
jgi:hypothetical protein